MTAAVVAVLLLVIAWLDTVRLDQAAELHRLRADLDASRLSDEERKRRCEEESRVVAFPARLRSVVDGPPSGWPTVRCAVCSAMNVRARQSCIACGEALASGAPGVSA